MKKFEVVFNIPSPYRLHMLRALWKELTARGIDFHVHFMARGHSDRPKSWLNPVIDFPHTYWRDWGIGQRHFNPGLSVHAIWSSAEWMLLGSPYDTVTCIAGILFGRCPNKIAGAEGNTKTPGIITGFVGWFKRLIYSRCRFASVPGHDAVKYFDLHQAYTKRQMPHPVIMPNLVDESRFLPRSQWPAGEIAKVREMLLAGTSASKICLIPARLELVKGLVPFIRHLELAWVQDWKILIMGQGSLRKAVLDAAQEKGLGGRLSILEYVAYDDMPKYYAASDLLLLPSIYDPNPLSVPEALFSGLPVALSDQAGNVEEGVTDHVNGWRLPVTDESRYPEVLREVFTAPIETLRAMGAESLAQNAEFWRTEPAVKRYLDELGAKKEA